MVIGGIRKDLSHLDNISQIEDTPEEQEAQQEEEGQSQESEMEELQDDDEDFEMKMPEKYHSTTIHANITV